MSDSHFAPGRRIPDPDGGQNPPTPPFRHPPNTEFEKPPVKLGGQPNLIEHAKSPFNRLTLKITNPRPQGNEINGVQVQGEVLLCDLVVEGTGWESGGIDLRRVIPDPGVGCDALVNHTEHSWAERADVSSNGSFSVVSRNVWEIVGSEFMIRAQSGTINRCATIRVA